MKRTLRILTLAALAACLLTVSALADSGPKPMLTVKVANAPEGLYYLDLLAEGPPYGEDYRTEENFTGYDQDLLQALRAAIPEGWHACILDGDLIFGDLTGELQGDTMIHTFSYFGVPDTYQILMVTKDGDSYLSPPCTRQVPPIRAKGTSAPIFAPSAHSSLMERCAPYSSFMPTRTAAASALPPAMPARTGVFL